MTSMKKTFSLLGLLLALVLAPMWGQAQAPVTKTEPTDQQRIADLEAYVNNTLRGADAPNAPMGSRISGAGPGHNGFQMVCAALVLFMTLPGLFIFYGGLVRRKNVLSVVAQCFGIAGLVTILWFFYGYSSASLYV